jgi:protein LTV1
MFGHLETETVKSRFTEYSMSSAVVPRSEVMQTHDERFEKLFEQYDEEECGALDEMDDGVNGGGDLSQFDSVLDAFLDKIEDTPVGPRWSKGAPGHAPAPPTAAELEQLAELRRKTAAMTFTEGTDQDKVLMQYVPKAEEEKWDCESILSTRSTLYNHPTRIVEAGRKIRLDPKTGIPMSGDTLKKERPSKKQLAAQALEEADEEEADDDEEEEPLNEGVARSRKETPAEKKARKQAIKDERRSRRQTKKATTGAFKDEQVKQEDAIKSNPAHGLKIKVLD